MSHELPASVIAELDQAEGALRQCARIVAVLYNELIKEGVPDPYAIGTAEALVLEALHHGQ